MSRNGRPPKTPEEKRKILRVRLSLQEKQAIKVNADKASLTVSEYVRSCGLGKHIVSKVNLKAVAELNRLGGLVKLCLMRISDHPEAPEVRSELNRTLKAIVSEIEHLRSRQEEA